MQQILNVITPATSYDLLAVDEMKTLLMIPPTDTTKDAMLAQLISVVSETIARICNRVFGFEEVQEDFYQLEDGDSRRLYLSRWPVKLDDIESMSRNDLDDVLLEDDWILEEETGTLYRPTSFWAGPIKVIYSGGYDLPDDAPGPLKFAAQTVVQQGYLAWTRNPSLFGVRQLSHKGSRVAYYDPSKMLAMTMGLPETWKQAQAVLEKYVRYWV